MNGLTILLTHCPFHETMVELGSFLSKSFGSDLALVCVAHVIMAEVIDETITSPTDRVVPLSKTTVNVHVRVLHLQAMDIE